MLTVGALSWLLISSVFEVDFYSFLLLIVSFRVVFANSIKELFNFDDLRKILRKQTFQDTLDETLLTLIFIIISIMKNSGWIDFLVQLLIIILLARFMFLGTNYLARNYFSKKGCT